MSQALTDLVRTLSLEQIDDHHYRGCGSVNDGAPNTYGGHFLGQSCAAALASVDDDRSLHSLHGYFLSGGEPGKPVDYAVHKIRDGNSFSMRRVTASQDGKTNFEMMVSLNRDAEGDVIEAQPPQDFDALPDPESLPHYVDLMKSHDPIPLPLDWALREQGVDIRVVNAPWAPLGPSKDNGIRMWIRANGELPDDPKLHQAILAYQSDESLADCLLVPFGVTWCSEGVFCVSLDHALWLHRPIDLNEWHFVEQRPLVVAHQRGRGSAEVWSRERQLVASFSQEGLVRLPNGIAKK